MRETIGVLTVLPLVAVLAVSAWIGCGSTRAKPLEVTYYYLPG